MALKVGKDCAVKITAATVVGMGTWSLTGITADSIEATAFNDNWKSYEFGAKDGGTIAFSGFCDPADTTGQEVLQLANIANTDMTTLRLFCDDTSYYEPCQTTGYFSPANTTGIETVLSHVNITSYDISADKSGLLAISFTAKVSGVMVLV